MPQMGQRQSPTRRLHGWNLQVWTNPDLSVEAAAALAGRVFAQVAREGFRASDWFDHIVISADPSKERSIPAEMIPNLDRDKNLICFTDRAGSLGTTGYRLRVGVSMIGVRENGIRLTFRSRDEAVLAIELGLPLAMDDIAHGLNDDNSYEVGLAAGSTGDVLELFNRQPKQKSLGKMTVRVGEGTLTIVPTWAGHKKCIRRDMLRLIV